MLRKTKKRAGSWLYRHGKELIIDGIIGVFVVGLLATGVLFVWISTLEIPDLSSFEQRRIQQSTKIYDRTGEVLLYDLHEDVKRTIVPFENISHHVKNATVAIEDDQFYQHIGVDFRAILRAAITNFTQGDLLGGQGGSTITQQVIKNSVLENEKRLTRKIKEAILSIKLERQLSKDQILSHYLNESPYGGTIYGIEEASQSFFGKSATDITLPEAAYLAALPQAPTRLSPYGNNRELLENRKNLVLERMLLNGFITQEEYDEAIAAEVAFEPQVISGIRAPHFVMYVREQLVDRFGEEALAERGLRIVTSLDWELQEKAEEIVAKRVAENLEKGYNATNAGLVATDPKTGDVLVMVGSRDYFDEEIDGNFNITIANRQPGSSIKPMVYASAFEKGYTPDTVVFDVKTQFGANCAPTDRTSETPCYSPDNYNFKFKGPISLRNALAQSLNIPAVKTLYLTGLKDAIKLTADLGITTLNDPDRLGLTLVLGGGEVKLLEHTGAYGVFANEGVKARRRSILRIEDAVGNVVEENDVVTERVMDRDVALMIANVLSDNVARTPLWGSNSLVHFPNRDVAAKSGSTNNLRDAWIMGFTPNIAVGAWSGNNDNEPMARGVLSGLITAPMWREFMDAALADLPVETFAEAPATNPNVKPILQGNIVDASVLLKDQSDTDDGTPALNIASLTGGIHNILHFVNKRDPNGPYPTNPAADSQYANWEYSVAQWKQETYGALLSNETNTEEGDDTEDAEE